MTHNWLWLDLETTGLDPFKDQILEVAALVADDGPGGTFEVVESVDTVVLPEHPIVCDDFVRNMHTTNGLLQSIALGKGMTLGDADDMLRAFVDQFLDEGTKVVIAGGSPGSVDMPFSRRYLPKLAERLHYRTFDVTTLKNAARVWGPGFEDIKTDKHRALYDAQASLREAKAFLDLISG